MGEAPDFHVGELVLVTVPFDPPHVLILASAVTWIWDEFVDVSIEGSAGTVVRFPRRVFDCGELEAGGPCKVEIGAFEQHFAAGEYDPEEEAIPDE